MSKKIMNLIWIIYFSILGLVFGSFFNVVGLRVPEKKSIVFPGSSCPNCNHNLKWFELIPVFSFIGLRGSCRSCKSRISFLYPIIEGITGCLFAFSFAKNGWSVELLLSILLISLVVIITVSDLKYMLIPDKILVYFTIIFVVIRMVYPTNPWWDFIAGAVIGFVLLLLIAIISKGGMGGGDVKLFFVLGLVLGLRDTLLTFMIATIFGALFGVLMIIIGRYTKRKAIPFGPFIGGASLVVFFYGNEIVSWCFTTLWY